MRARHNPCDRPALSRRTDGCIDRGVLDRHGVMNDGAARCVESAGPETPIRNFGSQDNYILV
jgi:hypothetical protein